MAPPLGSLPSPLNPYHGVVAIFGRDSGIFMFYVPDFVLIFETMERNNAVSQACCSGQRHVDKQSKHPSASAVDTTQFSVDALCIFFKVPGFPNHIDLVNLPKASINNIFVTPCIYKKSGGCAKLLFPSKNHHPSLGQIQDWFKCGNGQLRNLVTASDIVGIVPSLLADHLDWDGLALRLCHPLIQSGAPRCLGFTCQYTLLLSDTHYD